MVLTIIFSTTPGQTTKHTQNASASGVLSRKVMGNEIESLTTTNAISRALADTKVPGGIVRVFDCTEEPVKQRWQPGGASLSDILNAIVMADPQYYWQLDNGVINVLPAAGEPALLRVRVKELQVLNATSVYLAYSTLMSLPDVKKAVMALGLADSFERLQGPISLGDDKTGFNVVCRDVTLREALNAIVRADGKAVWAYHERHCNGRDGFSIEFLVQ